jgi:hypothetical protein
MSKAIQPIQGGFTRNELLRRFKCGKKMLSNAEEIAAELVSDFREGLPCDRVVGVKTADGSIEVRQYRSGLLNAYQSWVLLKLVQLCRQKGAEEAYNHAFKIRNQLTKEKFNAQLR